MDRQHDPSRQAVQETQAASLKREHANEQTRGSVRGLLYPLPLVYDGVMTWHKGETGKRKESMDKGHARFG
jgi:hypothetical protein